jgi:hypothetical protein
MKICFTYEISSIYSHAIVYATYFILIIEWVNVDNNKYSILIHNQYYFVCTCLIHTYSTRSMYEFLNINLSDLEIFNLSPHEHIVKKWPFSLKSLLLQVQTAMELWKMLQYW